MTTRDARSADGRDVGRFRGTSGGTEVRTGHDVGRDVELAVEVDAGVAAEIDAATDLEVAEDAARPSRLAALQQKVFQQKVFQQKVRTQVRGQDQDAAEFAMEFLGRIARLRGVRVDRARFLAAELRKAGVPEADVALAVVERPAAAGIDSAVLDAIATQAIAFETRKSSAMAFAAGIPGGAAMAAAIPADLAQYYVHAFRIMQKLAYLYGWQALLDDMEETDDESVAVLASMLGVMMGVGGANQAIGAFAARTVQPAIRRNVARQALTKTPWYPVLKSVLRQVGVKITKDTVAKSAAKVVPVLGAAVSGSLTYAGLSTQSRRLMAHLRDQPPARTGVPTA